MLKIACKVIFVQGACSKHLFKKFMLYNYFCENIFAMKKKRITVPGGLEQSFLMSLTRLYFTCSVAINDITSIVMVTSFSSLLLKSTLNA